MAFDVERVRAQFPGLSRQKDGRPVAFLDNPAGTQVPRSVGARMVEAMERHNANLGGAFDTSIEAEALVAAAHDAAATFVNAADPGEVFFGQSMTGLTFAMSRSLARDWAEGDEIVLSRMDHDGNVTPWMMAAAERGVRVKWLDFSRDSFEFDIADLDDLLTERTRLVAVCYASNVTGTVNDIAAIAARAKSFGALVYVDAVQFAPHGMIDVAELGCDFLVCSAYKFFGPHYGLFWGRRELLERLTAYKVRAAGEELPGRFVTGTTNREQLAGVHAAIDYIRALGRPATGGQNEARAQLATGYGLIKQQDDRLTVRLLDGLKAVRGARVLGITDPGRLGRRVSTVSFVLAGVDSLAFVTEAAARGIQLWSGHNYGIEPVRRLGLLDGSGPVRVGPVHYNTDDDIDRVVALADAMRG
jgi:cysteine desulfurase family protein (TIGR01976 family)